MRRDGWVGIDPGLKGGIAFLTEEKVETWDMPIIEADTKEHILVPELVELLAGMNPVIVAIEKQQAMPTDARNRVLKTGVGEGILIGVVAALRLPFVRVVPSIWQRLIFGKPHGDKGAHIQRALALFPDVDLVGQGKTGKRTAYRDGRADAVLIAQWARLTGGAQVG